MGPYEWPKINGYNDCGYNPYKWPCKRVSVVITLQVELFHPTVTLLITGFWAHLVRVESWIIFVDVTVFYDGIY